MKTEEPGAQGYVRPDPNQTKEGVGPRRQAQGHDTCHRATYRCARGNRVGETELSLKCGKEMGSVKVLGAQASHKTA